MTRVESQKWGQSPEDLRSLALRADHPRTRERFLALSLIADGTQPRERCQEPITQERYARPRKSARNRLGDASDPFPGRQQLRQAHPRGRKPIGDGRKATNRTPAKR